MTGWFRGGCGWLAASAVAACSFTPPYVRPPSSPAPAASYREAGDWNLARPGDAEPRGAWWTVFNDPELDRLESRVDDGNQNLAAAFARLQQARAETRIQRAGLLPTLNLNSSTTRGRTSVNSPRFPAGAEPSGGNFDLEADFSYEIDLWGRVRNSVSAARAGQQASAADLATLALSTHAELAGDYFALRGHDAAQRLLDQTVADYEKSLALTQRRFDGGVAAVADVAQAQAQLETARTQSADIRLQRAQTEHAIAVLVGDHPSTFHIELAPLPADDLPPPVGTGLPSTLLERRPDVAAAERRVAAANFDIGVARAAYFPQFSLAAAFGFDSVHASTWLDAPSRMWSAGPTGVLTVFDAGRHRAQSAQAHARFDEQVANYRNTVLSAYRDVEDALAALRELGREHDTETRAVIATGKALQQAQYRYEAGLVTYLEVATAENTNLQAQLSSLDIQMRQLSAAVSLVRALGGGWRDDAQSAASR